MVLSRQGVKSNMVILPAHGLQLQLGRSFVPGKNWIFQFYHVVCTERQFIIFGIVVDI